MRTNRATSFKARFTDGEEARACFHYSRLLDRIEIKTLDIYRAAVADIFGDRIARATMRSTSAAVSPAKSASFSRSWASEISPASFIAPACHRNAASGWSVCCTEPATKLTPRIYCDG